MSFLLDYPVEISISIKLWPDFEIYHQPSMKLLYTSDLQSHEVSSISVMFWLWICCNTWSFFCAETFSVSIYDFNLHHNILQFLIPGITYYKNVDDLLNNLPALFLEFQLMAKVSNVLSYYLCSITIHTILYHYLKKCKQVFLMYRYMWLSIAYFVLCKFRTSYTLVYHNC
jgi:hypothetical protein